MKKLRLLCIPPYEGMYHLMANIAAQRSDVDLIVHMGNLDDGLKAVDENRLNDIDAVISRGGTAETIRKHFDIPAYDITLSVYDVLRTIRLAQGMTESFALVGFSSLSTPANMLKEILQFDFPVCTIHSADECMQVLQDLKARGVQVIVGDTIAVTQAQSVGMKGLLIVSGLESIEAAIDQAIRTHSYYSKISRSAHLLSQILNSAERQTVVYSASGEIVYSTSDHLPERFYSILSQKFSAVIAQGSMKNFYRIGGVIYSVSGRSLDLNNDFYCIFEISHQTEASVYDRNRIQILTRGEDFTDSHPMEYYLGISQKIRDLQQNCTRCAQLTTPVLVVGDRGTGKNRFVHSIYQQSPLKNNTLLIIDCSLLDEKGWAFLLRSDSSPLTDSGISLYFMRVNAAEREQRMNLMYYLMGSHAATLNRLYFSFSTSIDFDPNDELYLYLSETLHGLRVNAPDLASRPEDIPSLISLYINAVNVQQGTRVIGFTPDAILMMQNHSWPHNVDQLYQAVYELVIRAKSSYISVDQVQELFEQDRVGKSSLTTGTLDLTRPLNEIMRDIVLQVYQEENMNQTHTAKRLGISRSTLWRMLK